MNAIVSEKGQVTIPKELRDKLGLAPGTTLEFRSEGGKLIACKSQTSDPFQKWWGKGKLPAKFKSGDAYLKSARYGQRD